VLGPLAPAVNADPAPVRSSPLFRLVVARTNVDAQARQIDGEFTVLAGSRVVASWSDRGSAESTRRAYESYRERHARLLRDGSIRVQDGVGVLTRDVVQLTAASPALTRDASPPALNARAVAFLGPPSRCQRRDRR